MATLTTLQAFQIAYNGQPNFMTPNILKRGKRGALHYEISQGTGIMNEPIYGVTVLEVHGQDVSKRRDLSTLFNSLNAAECYVRANFTKA